MLIVILIGVVGLAFTVLGVSLFVKTHKRDIEIDRDKFDRRNPAGVLEYDSYDEMRAAGRKQAGNVLRAYGAYFFTIVGIGLLITAYVQGGEASKLMAKESLEAAAANDEALKSACMAAAQSKPMQSLDPCREWCENPDNSTECLMAFGRSRGPRDGIEDEYQ